MLQEQDSIAKRSLNLQEICAKDIQRCLVGVGGST